MSLSEIEQVQAGLNLITSGILKHQLKYLNEFFGNACSIDLMIAKVFPNLKELTESMGAFYAVRNRIADMYSLNDPDIKIFCVGDGHTPRTAALFSFRSKWEAWSIDPQLRNRKYNISRLNVVPKRIEDFSVECDRAVLVAVHSHAPIKACLESIKAKNLAVIAIPCCINLDVPGHNPDFEYDDIGILSPHRKVKIWRNLVTK